MTCSRPFWTTAASTGAARSRATRGVACIHLRQALRRLTQSGRCRWHGPSMPRMALALLVLAALRPQRRPEALPLSIMATELHRGVVAAPADVRRVFEQPL